MTSVRRPLAVFSAVALTAIAALTSANPAQSSTSTRQLAVARPLLSLQAAARNVRLDSYGHSVYLNLGIYAVAGDEPFEVRLNRADDYQTPIEGRVVMSGGDLALPAGLVKSFRGLPHFLRVEITNADGDVVLTKSERFCPTGDAIRVRPNAPDVSTYPFDCPYNPFTLGAVFGIETGFGVPAVDPYARPAHLKPGRYTATVSITPTYANLLGLSAEDSTSTVNVRVLRSQICGPTPIPVPLPHLGCKAPTHAGHTSRFPLTPAKTEPSHDSVVPAPDTLPDLRSLPSSGIELGKNGFLKFGATVWDAGPAPMVVDGFRSGPGLMKAYQYFYHPDGTPAGHARAGRMEWDPRPGHDHWHFRDFARYQLLDKDKNVIVRSRKEAFCLADTDAVDYTVLGANWRPYNTDLHTACGDHSSLAVREVLDSGSGDTYYQSLPGQSFNVNDLPNGVYYIAIEANPKGHIFESDTTNNISYRKIRLSGHGINRTVTVPPVGLVDAN